MGAQWKHAGRLDAAARKGKVVGKLVKEIIVSARAGGPDPSGNARLRAALESARKASVTRDTIERAVKKGAGLLDEPLNYDTVVYEGFAPHQVPVIVECLTENKNRTAGDIRVLFRKGQLGSSGSVGWMFDRLGIVEATTTSKGIDIEEVAIEAGAQNVEAMDAADLEEGQAGAIFYTEPTDLDVVNKAVTALGWAVSKAELGYVPKNYVDVQGDARKEVEQFLGDIQDNDDVHRIYTAIK